MEESEKSNRSSFDILKGENLVSHFTSLLWDEESMDESLSSSM